MTPSPLTKRLMKGKMSLQSSSFIVLNIGLAFTDLAAPVPRLLVTGSKTLIVQGIILRS